MRKRILPFRRLKNGDPEKFKVLVEDLPRPPLLDRLSAAAFWSIVLAGSVMVFAGVCLALAGFDIRS